MELERAYVAEYLTAAEGANPHTMWIAGPWPSGCRSRMEVDDQGNL